jgi:hypothetical protein
MRMLMARWASLMLVLMSHLHVNGHDYMEIRLIRLMSIRYQFAVLPQSPRHGLGLGTAPIRGLASAGPRSGLCHSNGPKGE